jgi:hypothetical protein
MTKTCMPGVFFTGDGEPKRFLRSAPLSMSPASTSQHSLHKKGFPSHGSPRRDAHVHRARRDPFFPIPRPPSVLRARARLDPPSLRSTSWRPLFHLDTESPRNGSLTSSLLPVTDHRRGALPEHNLPIMAITTEDAASCFVFFCF